MHRLSDASSGDGGILLQLRFHDVGGHEDAPLHLDGAAGPPNSKEAPVWPHPDQVLRDHVPLPSDLFEAFPAPRSRANCCRTVMHLLRIAWGNLRTSNRDHPCHVGARIVGDGLQVIVQQQDLHVAESPHGMCCSSVVTIGDLQIQAGKRQEVFRRNEEVSHLHSCALPGTAKVYIAALCPTDDHAQSVRQLFGSRPEVLKLRGQGSHHCHTTLAHLQVGGSHHDNGGLHGKRHVDLSEVGSPPPSHLMVVSPAIYPRPDLQPKVSEHLWVPLHFCPRHTISGNHAL
mmetsp:Transcript_95921/g.214707  ORF Transcript_95921/g.214707 Transcript_95921/m.214707 type:complete len:287 (+) Transcript_95921:329-1189(+)